MAKSKFSTYGTIQKLVTNFLFTIPRIDTTCRMPLTSITKEKCTGLDTKILFFIQRYY